MVDPGLIEDLEVPLQLGGGFKYFTVSAQGTFQACSETVQAESLGVVAPWWSSLRAVFDDRGHFRVMLVSCGNGQSWVRPCTLLVRQVSCDCDQHWFYSFLNIATATWSLLMWVGYCLRCWQLVVDLGRPVQLLLGKRGCIDGRVSSRIEQWCGHFTNPGSWRKMVVSIALVIKREGHIVARSAQVPIQMVMILYRADLLHFLFGSWNGTVPTVTLLRGDGDLSCVNPRNKLRQRVLLPRGRKSGVSSKNQLHIVSLIMGARFLPDSLIFWFCH